MLVVVSAQVAVAGVVLAVASAEAELAVVVASGWEDGSALELLVFGEDGLGSQCSVWGESLPFARTQHCQGRALYGEDGLGSQCSVWGESLPFARTHHCRAPAQIMRGGRTRSHGHLYGRLV